MDDFILSLLFSLFIFCLLYFPVKGMLTVNRKIGYNYAIRFKDSEDIPDLENDSGLKKVLTVVSHFGQQYTVQSKWSDQKLKEILMKKYKLSSNQVVVQSIQASGVLGML